MSQLFDYFVCSRSLMDEWAEALQQADEDLQAKVEGGSYRPLPGARVGEHSQIQGLAPLATTCRP